MVPENWLIRTPSCLFKLFSGFAFKSTDAQESGAKWLKIANVGIGTIKWDIDSFLPRNYLDIHEKYVLNKGDIVVALTRPTLGNKLKVARLLRDEDRSLLNQRVAKIVCNKSVSTEFVFQLLRSDEFAYRVNVGLLGTDPPNLSIKVLEDFDVLVPPEKEQRKIAKILSTWDKAISTTERLIDNSKQQKKALMQQLLTGKKRLLDHSGKPFEGEWDETKLNSVLDLMRSGLSRKLENDNVGIAVIRSNNMGMKYTNNVDLKYWFLDDPQGAKVENYILSEGDLLVNFINSLSQIGKACIYKKEGAINAIYTTNILRIKANQNKIDPTFLFLLTQTEKYNSHVKSITKPAVNQASFTTKEFGNFIFLLPPINEQKKIATVLINADREIELLEQQLADLKQEKKALMQQLLTGKRRVNVEQKDVG